MPHITIEIPIEDNKSYKVKVTEMDDKNGCLVIPIEEIENMISYYAGQKLVVEVLERLLNNPSYR